MKRSKLFSGILAIMLIVSLAIPARASNTDTSFKFSFGSGGGQSMDQYTSRAKEDDTSTYVYYKAGVRSSIGILVYGTKTKGVIKRNDRGGYSNVYDCVRPNYSWPSIKKAQRGFIRQLVYERGYPYAVLGSWSDMTVCTCTGVWSPDSVPEAGIKTLN